MSRYTDIEAALAKGGVALLPTETVYGLAARADNSRGVEAIYRIKGRDFDKPLAVCVRDLEQAETLAVFDDLARDLAERYWPGSLTLVIPVRPETRLDPRTRSGETIALRCPEASWRDALTLPLALTSANRSGEADCTDHAAATAELGAEIDADLKADRPLSGAPSTIVSVVGGKPTLLRQGALELELDV